MNDEPLLSVRGLSKRYGARLGCSNVSFDVWPGEVLAIVGESGSGKTTLLNCISTRLTPSSGAVFYRMRDGTVRAESAAKPNETAHDLIPPISEGVVLSGSPGAGERFIQPLIGTSMLDDHTGSGWRLFFHGEVESNGPHFIAAHDAAMLEDGGAVLNWLDRHSSNAVLVRPDHYVFGSGDAVELVHAMCRALGMAEEIV